MMERLREGVNSLAVKIILSLIIFSFVFAGVGGYLASGTTEPAAKVGDQEISRNQFEQAYQNERQQMQAQAGDFFSTLLSDPTYLAQFRQNVLDRMVNQALLDQQASKLGLRVSDVQVKNEIRSMPAFASNGIFNNEQYLAALRRTGLSPDQFAEYVRQDMVRAQLIGALTNSEFALENELQAIYQLEGQTRMVRTVTLPLSEFADKADITDEQKKAYYEQNPSQFVRPEQFKISYVELTGNSIADLADVTEEEAKAYYEANKATYGTAEQRKVSHIMIQGDDATAKAKAEKVLAELNAGADFAALAKTESDDTFSAEQGGQLDWFDKGVMDPAFEDAAFALTNKGDVSGVVQSEFGYHIIKLDDVKPSDAKPFAEVKDEILATLKQQHAADKFYSLSNELAEKAFEMPDNLDEAAAAVNANVEKTDFVSLADLQGALANPTVLQALQQPEVQEDGLNSNIIEIAPEHVMVVRIDDSRPEIVLPYEDVEAQVTALLKRQEGENAAQTLANSLVKELSEGNDAGLNASGYTFGTESEINRGSPEREVAELAFTMATPADGKSEYGFTRAVNGDVVLVALDSVNEPEAAEISLESQLADRVSRTLANTELASVVEQLKADTKVTYSLEQVEQ
ncbi:peptidylprolyl isomerase [Enterovibrio nigricans]|uniref:Periplasmic chaperone PpiD n=1 Tax=Enterovibrio nigricans DSM 22720 TaxID=1121868 RepID=A0A1T4USD8_9GAMM|nr:peptidylprolyl isomerase [Enterovibrio nigricans]PKF51027.1 peptidylprolyl isomerase [Enterovibrio nigricans]SKA55570.1 peptidyl-prolyl cis-trans isomerase D [Enterovibrio nigricans DSM 22720]